MHLPRTVETIANLLLVMLYLSSLKPLFFHLARVYFRDKSGVNNLKDKV